MTVTPSIETRERVRVAMEAAPRATFLPPAVRWNANADLPLAIGFGATNSQPSTVAEMVALLDVPAGARVLDVGSGSGWTTAILGRLVGPAGRVVGIDVVPELVEAARGSLGELEPPMPWVTVEQASPAAVGLPDAGPWDRILVSADAGFVPRALADQLADGGRMVIPSAGYMVVVDRAAAAFAVNRSLGTYSFVRLILEAAADDVLPGSESFSGRRR